MWREEWMDYARGNRVRTDSDSLVSVPTFFNVFVKLKGNRWRIHYSLFLDPTLGHPFQTNTGTGRRDREKK